MCMCTEGRMIIQFWVVILTCDTSLGVKRLEDLIRDDAMADLAPLLWQGGYWDQTLGRCVEVEIGRAHV